MGRGFGSAAASGPCRLYCVWCVGGVGAGEGVREGGRWWSRPGPRAAVRPSLGSRLPSGTHTRPQRFAIRGNRSPKVAAYTSLWDPESGDTRFLTRAGIPGLRESRGDSSAPRAWPRPRKAAPLCWGSGRVLGAVQTPARGPWHGVNRPSPPFCPSHGAPTATLP